MVMTSEFVMETGFRPSSPYIHIYIWSRLKSCRSVLQCVAVCCSVLQCVAVCCSVLQCVAVCCSVLQRVVVCCSVLQCAAVCCSVVQCDTYILKHTYMYVFLSSRSWNSISSSSSRSNSEVKGVIRETVEVKEVMEGGEGCWIAKTCVSKRCRVLKTYFFFSGSWEIHTFTVHILIVQSWRHAVSFCERYTQVHYRYVL